MDNPGDRFDIYFAEKLWQMIPAVYRHEDGIATTPGVLRALVEVTAEQAAVVRKSHDRLWEDLFIELCDDWAVPYIADLVGTRLVSALNPRGRRVDVAKTIYYRRRKGTLRILEELIGDIAGWEGVVVENFCKLARARHGLDPQPLALAGRISGALPGGWADLRKPRTCALAGGAFDEFHYIPDFRRHRGGHGRFAIPKLAFHLYRITSYRVKGVTPFALTTPGRFTFDPSGRDSPLFAPRGRGGRSYSWNQWKPLREWELPGPIGCRLLNEQEAKTALIPGAISVSRVPDYEFTPGLAAAADLSAWNPPSGDHELILDPLRGRFIVPGASADASFAASYHYGFSGELGAGTYARQQTGPADPDVRKIGGGSITAADQIVDGVLQVDDSATYDLSANPSTGVRALHVRSADRERPYVRLGAPWLLEARSDAGAPDATLLIEGLWLGSDDIILVGDYERVEIRHATFDPGGRDAEGRDIATVNLVVEGHVEKLVIRKAIVGGIGTRGEGLVEDLEVEDSIIQAVGRSDPTIDLPDAIVRLRRTTVFGAVRVKELYASEAIVEGEATIRNVQAGCFRFSAAPKTSGHALPRPYRCFWMPPSSSAHYFTSRRFGDAEYGELSEAAPQELREGAENGSEMGAWNGGMRPIRARSLDSKVAEYMPFGLIPIYINAT